MPSLQTDNRSFRVPILGRQSLRDTYNCYKTLGQDNTFATSCVLQVH
jgi:hypothetical protein